MGKKRLHRWPISVVHDLIGDNKPPKLHLHWKYKRGSNKLLMFAKHPYCSCCGIKAKWIYLEKPNNCDMRKDGYLPAFLNFYAIAIDGNKIKLTIDHIVPISKGGISKPGNLQVLCEFCNTKKANRIVSNKEIWR